MTPASSEARNFIEEKICRHLVPKTCMSHAFVYFREYRTVPSGGKRACNLLNISQLQMLLFTAKMCKKDKMSKFFIENPACIIEDKVLYL